MKYLAEELDERNLGQVLIWTEEFPGDGATERRIALIQEIVQNPTAGVVEVITADNVETYRYGDEVETTLSPELRMLRILMNTLVGIETAMPGNVSLHTAEEC